MKSDLARRIKIGERRALAKAITLLESTKASDSDQAVALLQNIAKYAPTKSIRIGICGSPGVGKSSFIDVLGAQLIATKHKVAVLAVDPSSPLSGGSILGDKTRMETLSNLDEAFIRPSPGGGVPGGITANTHEVIQLLEFAGFDLILLETVGIGQSETDVANLVDRTIYLHQPESGDDLQAIKKGIVEVSDYFVVTKADGALKASAENAARQLRGVVADAGKQVFCVSSTEKSGFTEITDILLKDLKEHDFSKSRSKQTIALLTTRIMNDFKQRFQRSDVAKDAIELGLKGSKSLRELSSEFLAAHVRL